jgi:hypothetical protein
LERVKNVCTGKLEEDVKYVLDKLNITYQVTSRDDQYITIGNPNPNPFRMNLIVKDNIVTEIYFS